MDASRPRDWSRRDFAGALFTAAVGVRWIRPAPGSDPGARLSVRPGTPHGAPAHPGAQPLGLRSGRDGVLYVPNGYAPATPVPLVLALHGATGSSAAPLRTYSALADRLGAAVLAPESLGSSWDAIRDDFGVDRDFIGRALEAAWSRVAIDPRRIGVVGFSDGATYALALGRANGDLFHAVAAFSPGFLIPITPVGRPPIFISHGTSDHILPIDACSRRIVPALRAQEYQVDYREFDGDHTVPPEMAEAGLRSVTSTS